MAFWAFLVLLIVIVDPRGGVRRVAAQLNPTPLPEAGSQPTKPAGVAEEAKEGVDKLPTTPVLPQAKSKRKRFELFELDGYLRLRTDWMKNFNLDFDDDPALGGAPFPRALACQQSEGNSDCSGTLKSANMRLRLEPTINVNETTQVYLQVDVLDNIVLGSTPDTLGLGGGRFDIPLTGFSDGQLAPEASRNSLHDSIQVNRAWAEIETSLGQVSFGRMPWHWGMGIYANGGAADPFSGNYNLDSETGDTVDRVMFRAEIPGTEIDAAIATDWSSTFPVASEDAVFQRRITGQPWDLDDNDDVSTWVVMLSRFDTPKLFDEQVARGDLVLNYGGFLAYRTQKNALRDSIVSSADETLADRYVRRGLKTYTPDVWFKAGKGKVLVEAEAVAVIGGVDNVGDIALSLQVDENGDPLVDSDGNPVFETLTSDTRVNIRRFGGVARATYRALEDKMRLSMEAGFASGDQWDNQLPGRTHVSNVRPLPVGNEINDNTISNFFFDPNYHVDLLLFRELLGTITNAIYAKPTVSYDLTSEISIRAASILSFAHRPVATPGNGTRYGIEFNGDVGYHSGGFFAGVSYGILFPLSALDHPADQPGGNDPGFGYGDNAGSAGNAQTIQTRLVLQF